MNTRRLHIFLIALVGGVLFSGCGDGDREYPVGGVELYHKALAGKVKRVKIERAYQEYWFEEDTVSYVMTFYVRAGADLATAGEYWIRPGDSIIKEANTDTVLAIHEGQRIKYRLLFPLPEDKRQVEALRRGNGQY